MIASNVQQTANKKILVLGYDTRMVLPIARSLGRKGIVVDVAWCPAESPAVCSKFIRHFHKIALPEPDDNSWIDDLRAVIDAHHYDLVIPAAENYVYLLQKNRAAFEQFGSVYLVNDEVFQTAFDKMKTWELAHSLGISVPDSKVCCNEEDLNAFLTTASYPLILKPDCSVGLNDARGKNYVMTAYNANQAREIFRKLSTGCLGIHLQRLVSGAGVGVEFLASKGELLAVHQHRRIHETSGHGSTYRCSTAVSPELFQATAKIIKHLNYTGVGMAEFRVDDQSKQWWFLELNARFWGSLPLAVAAGVDFPFYLYQLLVESETNFDVEYRPGTRCRNLRNDIRWHWHWLRQNFNSRAVLSAQQTGWKTNSIPSTQVVWDLLRMMTFRDHQDIFAIDDCAPGFWEARQIAGSFIRKVTPGKRGSLRRSAIHKTILGSCHSQ